MTRAHTCFRVSAVLSLLVGLSLTALHAQELPIVYGVEAQPLKSQAKRVAQALEFLGQPLSADGDQPMFGTEGMRTDSNVQETPSPCDLGCIVAPGID